MTEHDINLLTAAFSVGAAVFLAAFVAAVRKSERRLRALRLDALELRMQLRGAALNKILIGENGKLVARGIDQGSLFIETGHRVVSEVTFGLLQLFPTTRGRAYQIRETHNAISQGIYGAFREINRQVGGSIAEGLRKGRPAKKKPVSALLEKRRNRRATKKKAR